MVVVPVLAVGGAVAERRSHAVGHGDALREGPSCGGCSGAVPSAVSNVGVQAVALQDDVSLVIVFITVALSQAAAASAQRRRTQHESQRH